MRSSARARKKPTTDRLDRFDRKLLAALAAHGCLTPAEAADRAGIDEKSARRALLDLAKAGAVVRAVDATAVLYSLADVSDKEAS